MTMMTELHNIKACCVKLLVLLIFSSIRKYDVVIHRLKQIFIVFVVYLTSEMSKLYCDAFDDDAMQAYMKQIDKRFQLVAALLQRSKSDIKF